MHRNVNTPTVDQKVNTADTWGVSQLSNYFSPASEGSRDYLFRQIDRAKVQDDDVDVDFVVEELSFSDRNAQKYFINFTSFKNKRPSNFRLLHAK